MERISLAAFERERKGYDDLVGKTAGIDRFCSASDWVLAAHAAWAGHSQPRILRGEHGYAVFLDHVDAEGVCVLLSFDTMWGFTCPLVGPDPEALAEEFAAQLELDAGTWQIALLTGLDRGSELFYRVSRRLAGTHVLRLGAPLRRWLASLDGGLDGFLERRTPKFRESLRRSLRMVEAAGIEMVSERVTGAARVEEIFRRVLEVEERSWKGPAETGLLLDELRDFYREVAARWARRGELRALFALRDGEDAGYVLGGTLGRTYRGFQFSFDHRYRQLSLGNVMQYAQIRELCEEGYETYDLGIDMPYKRRWAESTFDTVTLAVFGLS